MRRVLVSTLVTAVVLVGCSGSTVGASCSDAFADASSTEGEAMQEAMAATLTACDDYDEWLAGFRGQAPDAAVDEEASLTAQMQLAGWCDEATAPVCDDARAQGVLE